MSLPHSKPDITDREGNTVSQEYILEMTGITKEFPGVRALKGVELKVRPGTVHTLMGENGAGKSTLMKCLIGIHPPTSGTILFEGKEVRFKNTLEALNAGISMIHGHKQKNRAAKCKEKHFAARLSFYPIKRDHIY